MIEEPIKKVRAFPHLFMPLRIGRVELPNRIVMLPMTTGFCRSDQTVGERFIRFYAQRARGGAGMIVIPFSPIAAVNWWRLVFTTTASFPASSS